MKRQHRCVWHLAPLLLVVSIIAGMLGAILTTRPASASRDGNWRWEHQWVAGGYQPFTGRGVQAHIKTHAPADALFNDDQSLARIAVVSPDGKQAIEVGWIEAPWHYGDTQPHLYVAHHFDTWYAGPAYCYVGGYNSDCGWVQLSATQAPGMALAPETSHTFKLTFYASYWQVSYDSEIIGMLPAGDFTQMGRAEWYGEADAHDAWPCADMGNGIYGTQAGSATMSLLFVQHWDWSLTYATPSSHATTPRLYNVGPFTASLGGYSFGYGGPGAC